VETRTPIITGFGFEARSGKDSCADYLVKTYRGSKILRTSFARRLRSEVHTEMYRLVKELSIAPREALRVMCEQRNVPFDPLACRDVNDPHSKQRALLQLWGMERRAQSATYWLDKVAEEIMAKQPDLVIISDMRFVNEADWIKSTGGKTVHVVRPHSGLTGSVAMHPSENSLVGYEFDYTIHNDSTLKVLQARANEVFAEIRQMRLFP
jgi:hypothetical protein